METETISTIKPDIGIVFRSVLSVARYAAINHTELAVSKTSAIQESRRQFSD